MLKPDSGTYCSDEKSTCSLGKGGTVLPDEIAFFHSFSRSNKVATDTPP
jgi:hypothetical protein